MRIWVIILCLWQLSVQAQDVEIQKTIDLNAVVRVGSLIPYVGENEITVKIFFNAQPPKNVPVSLILDLENADKNFGWNKVKKQTKDESAVWQYSERRLLYDSRPNEALWLSSFTNDSVQASVILPKILMGKIKGSVPVIIQPIPYELQIDCFQKIDGNEELVSQLIQKGMIIPRSGRSPGATAAKKLTLKTAALDTVLVLYKCDNSAKRYTLKKFPADRSGRVVIAAGDLNDIAGDNLTVFSQRRQPKQIRWDQRTDRIETLAASVQVRVRAWANPDFTAGRTVDTYNIHHIFNTDITTANALFAKHFFGVQLVPDSTSVADFDPRVFSWRSGGPIAIYCSSEAQAALVDSGRYETNCLNVYYTDTGDAYCGLSCSEASGRAGNRSIIGKNTLVQTFIHEIGHFIGLYHLDTLDNIMRNVACNDRSASALRQSFTIGQTYKANFSHLSGLSSPWVRVSPRVWTPFYGRTSEDNIFRNHTNSYPCIYFGPLTRSVSCSICPRP